MDSGSQEVPQKWPRSNSRVGEDLALFRVRFDYVVNPRNQKTLRRLVLETPDWCNVVALTKSSEIVATLQYRIGSGSIEVELPGGTVEPQECALTAAKRELLEETGFKSDSWTYLGYSQPNPAFHDNRVHHWLATDSYQAQEPQPGNGEDIVVHLMPMSHIYQAIEDRKITSSLVLVALARVFDIRDNTLKTLASDIL